MDSRELQDVVQRLNGLTAAVECGFANIKGELRYRDKADTWLRLMFAATTVLAIISVMVAGYAVTTASSNRALIVELVRQTNEQGTALARTKIEIEQAKREELPR